MSTMDNVVLTPKIYSTVKYSQLRQFCQLPTTYVLPLAALNMQQARSMPPQFAEAATNNIHHWQLVQRNKSQ